MNHSFPCRLIELTFWLAPGLMLLSDLCGAVFDQRLFWVSTHCFWLSFYAFLGLIVGMVQLLHVSPYALIAGLIAAFGALIGITIIGMARYAWGVSTAGVGAEVLASAHAHPLVFFSSRAPGITFPLGLILLAVGLKRNRLIGTGAFIGLVTSILLFPIGRISGHILVNVIGDGLMLIFFGRVGQLYGRAMRTSMKAHLP